MENLSDYKIIHSYNPSGQKEVHLIEHSILGLCMFKKGCCDSQTSLERIKREVAILRGIESEYYPKIFSFEYLINGEFVILEEYVESNNLREIMNLYNNEKEVVKLLIKIINALTVLWNNEIVHRDLKPENILIRKESREPVIIDLGIARDNNATSLTKSIYHSGPGTNGYCSPEQLTNDKDSICYKSDFFSIGVIMAELIIGCNPFSPKLNQSGLSNNDNILKNKYLLTHNDKVVSEELSKVIHKLLKVLPYQRYRTYKTLLTDLERIV